MPEQAKLEGLSRRGFLGTAAAVAAGRFAFAQGPARAAIVRTDIAEPSALRQWHDPGGHPSRARRQRQRPDRAHAGSRVRDAGPAGGAAAAWLSGARLQLAQGDAAAGGGGLSRDRARPARLRAHHGLGRFLRRRSRSLPHSQHGAATPSGSSTRSATARWRWSWDTMPERRSRPGPRSIRPDIFRSVTIMSSPFEGPPSLPFDTANGAAPPRPAPTDDELDAELAKLNPPRKYYQNYQRTRGRQRQHAACAARAPRVLPRLLPLQERRLEREQAASA